MSNRSVPAKRASKDALFRICGKGVDKLLLVGLLGSVCLFVLYWVFTGLLECFSLLISLFYLSPGEWTLYKQHRELDAYWESVDPDEFARRERAAAERRKGKRR